MKYLKDGETGTIARLDIDDYDTMIRLAELGLGIGEEVTSVATLGGNKVINLHGVNYMVDNDLIASIKIN